MVDSSKRKQLADLLEAFILCKLTNDEFEDRSYEVCPSGRMEGDRVLIAVLDKAWFMYDDLYEHRMKGRHTLSPAGLAEVNRWILFLRTDLEYEWPIDRFISIGACLPNLLTLGLWGRIAGRSRGKRMNSIGSWHLWPFMRESDYQQAVTQGGQQIQHP